MREYVPDVWVILKISSEGHGTVNKVFAGWYGGYTGSDSWKLNSGIEKTEDMGDHYLFTGATGSVYKCYKNSVKMSGYMSMILSGWQEKFKDQGATFEVVDVETVL